MKPEDHPSVSRCPTCRCALLATMHRSGEGYVFAFQVYEGDEKAILQRAILGYLRWVAEGKKKYGSGGQYYYDPYHSYIEYYPEMDDYSFSIQTSDSPEGDTWWRGRCTLWGTFEVHEIKEEVHSSM